MTDQPQFIAPPPVEQEPTAEEYDELTTYLADPELRAALDELVDGAQPTTPGGHPDPTVRMHIMAANLSDARHYATRHSLGNRWLFVRDASQLRGVAYRALALAPGWESNPRYSPNVIALAEAIFATGTRPNTRK